MSLIYRNRSIINQRGGSIDIDNTTEQEKFKISHRSGSNINFTNVVTSELATNNKQTNIVNDSFSTVGGDSTEYIGGNMVERIAKNKTSLKGFSTDNEIESFSIWKNIYSNVADIVSKFKIKRGGLSYPNGIETDLEGERDKNPVLDNKIYSVENKFNGYNGIPIRKSSQDDVAAYAKVPDKGNTRPATERKLEESDIEKSAGILGSNAPGVIEFGPSKSASTENGKWSNDEDAQNISNKILEIQDELTQIEKNMGDGGDEIQFTKRNKFEQVGAIFNDYPSIRIDPKGRSQPFEILISDKGVYKNHDYIPHAEDVDNSSNFPCGNDDKVVCNRYSRVVGSGGINLKTTGPLELGATSFKGGFKTINLNASHGITLGSEESVELQSLKTITLRTNRQVYAESSLGVKGNTIIGGGLLAEGETYIQHITAPLEVQQTEDTVTFGKFATDEPRKLVIGECQVGSRWYPVYALPKDDIILNYPHSHHYNGIPMRLCESNEDVRKLAQLEGLNKHTSISQALPQMHEKKLPVKVD